MHEQARNTDAERKASEVRLRAERRTGELLKELARAETSRGGNTGGNQHVAASKHATPPPASPYAETLARTGLSRQTAHRYQALANVPKETFEAALREPQKPTTSGVIAHAMAAASRCWPKATAGAGRSGRGLARRSCGGGAAVGPGRAVLGDYLLLVGRPTTGSRAPRHGPTTRASGSAGSDFLFPGGSFRFSPGRGVDTAQARAAAGDDGGQRRAESAGAAPTMAGRVWPTWRRRCTRCWSTSRCSTWTTRRWPAGTRRSCRWNSERTTPS